MEYLFIMIILLTVMYWGLWNIIKYYKKQDEINER
jgi:hypothetical protein